MRSRSIRRLLFSASILVVSIPASALNITFDYSKDATGFFSDPVRKAILNQAASYYTAFTDSLSAIIPSGTNTITTNFPDPATGLTDSLINPSIPANTLIIYVGSRELGGSTLGQGGPGGYSGSGTGSWITTISTRGQTGATNSSSTSTEFGPWGGAISFDSSTNWYFGSSISGISGSQADFLSVAIHELGHVLGFGTAASYFHDVSGNSFIGSNAESVYGFSVPLLSPAHDHWANNVGSYVPGTSIYQETEMDPDISVGTRKVATVLDYAALKDIGWSVPSSDLAFSALIGDTNHDGVVDLTDLNNILNNFGASGLNNPGDSNNDQVVDLTDLNNVLNHFGSSLAPSGLSIVPEPASLSLFCAAAFLVTRRRRA